MAQQKSIEENNRILDWLENSKESAKKLLEQAEIISEKMFKSGDLNLYFSLLSKFSYFDYRNILLLSAQYPNATDLAGFKTWKAMLPQEAIILKKEYQGKGIYLLAPYTEFQGDKPYLIWFTIKMFDISQTSVKYNKSLKSLYISDRKEHIEFLVKAFRNFISEEFKVEFVFVTTDLHTKTGSLCYSKDNVIYIRANTNELEQLSYMIEYIIKSNANMQFTNKINIYLAMEVRDCLFKIWNLPKLFSYAPPYEDISQMPDELRNVFFNQAQQWVRNIEDFVLFEYKNLQKNNEDSFIYEDEMINSFFQYT